MSTFQQRAKIVVFIEWVCLVVDFIGLLFWIIYFWANFDAIVDKTIKTYPSIKREDAEAYFKMIIILIGVLGLIVCWVQTLLNAVLHKGVYQMSAGHLKFWYIFQLVLFVLGILVLVISLMLVVAGAISLLGFFGYVISFVYRGISIEIISNFKKEVANNNNGGTA